MLFYVFDLLFHIESPPYRLHHGQWDTVCGYTICRVDIFTFTECASPADFVSTEVTYHECLRETTMPQPVKVRRSLRPLLLPSLLWIDNCEQKKKKEKNTQTALLSFPNYSSLSLRFFFFGGGGQRYLQTIELLSFKVSTDGEFL